MRRVIRYGLGWCLAAAAAGAWASSELALAQGCFSCHGDPPRASAPTFPQLAAQYARYRGELGAEIRLADRLREHPLFGSITAHERLSDETARMLMRWLIQGAP